MEVAAMEIAPINRPTAHLMTSRRFAPLFWTQFLSAFNDNFLKNTLVFLILFTLAADQAASLVTLAGAVFMAPFLLLVGAWRRDRRPLRQGRSSPSV